MEEKDNKKKIDKDAIFYYLAMAMLYLILIVTVGYVGSRIISFTKEWYESGKKITTDTYKIQSIKYDEDIEGHYSRTFTLGSGNVSEKSYYVIYQILEDGGRKLEKLDVNKTIIYENLENGVAPYVEYDKNGFGETVAIRLYLPQNTIIQEYDLSLD